jgi:Kef-type K+ transport system membrane component KefB
MESYPTELLLIAGAAMLAPILAELPKNIRIPVVVVEIFLGILIGPHVFGLASASGMVAIMGGTGIGLPVVFGWA